MEHLVRATTSVSTAMCRRALPVPLSATHLSRFCTSRPAPPQEEKPWEKSLQGPLPVVALFAFGMWYVTAPKSGEVQQSMFVVPSSGAMDPCEDPLLHAATELPSELWVQTGVRQSDENEVRGG
eukprot:CAMPEP_0194488642 /NCGR_PEP_ID=MMETSP0253-20130528/8490_1 /TAXON_ID=2966 /ORGANISM="Noctiluca scintillans" /LENGTH=123 /DNA_ID=CAMNT_0039329033 /DNA_START=41 /DNA_END=409 /DNA_ORIENTATION=+